MSEVLEGEVTTAGDVQFVDEQEQPQEQPEKKAIDLNELCFKKLKEFQASRANAQADAMQNGARLLRVPYDRLVFGSADELREEILRINAKTSRLSSTERYALLELRNAVVWDLMQAQEESSKDAVDVESE